MSFKKKKTDAAAAAANRIKAAALSAVKGLSRTQAERTAAAAARNVNAYGQKEEGPSRWQERKEAKRQMYLMSTERAVILGVRKEASKPGTSFGVGSQQCQKCFQMGHWTYECKNERVYISRPTRTQQLANPKLRPKLMDSRTLQQGDVKADNDAREVKRRNLRSDDPVDFSSVDSHEIDRSGDYKGKSHSGKIKRRRGSPSASPSDDVRLMRK